MIKTIEIAVTADAAARERLSAKLRDMAGVEDARFAGDTLRVSYDLRATNNAMIVAALEAADVVPVLSWYERLRLHLRCYREAVLREDLNNEIGWDSFVREIYVSRYRHRRHGRRDDRPRHWRQYTAPPPSE